MIKIIYWSNADHFERGEKVGIELRERSKQRRQCISTRAVSTFLEKVTTRKKGAPCLVGCQVIFIIVEDTWEEVIMGYNRDFDYRLIQLQT